MTVEMKADAAHLMNLNLDDARRAFATANDPTAVVVIADGDDEVGQWVVGQILGEEDVRRVRDLFRSMRPHRAFTAAVRLERALALVRYNAGAQITLRRAVPPGKFTALLVSGSYYFAFVPIKDAGVADTPTQPGANRPSRDLPSLTDLPTPA